MSLFDRQKSSIGLVATPEARAEFAIDTAGVYPTITVYNQHGTAIGEVQLQIGPDSTVVRIQEGPGFAALVVPA